MSANSFSLCSISFFSPSICVFNVSAVRVSDFAFNFPASSYSRFAFFALAQPPISSVKNARIGDIAFSNGAPSSSFKSPIAFCNCWLVPVAFATSCAMPLYWLFRTSTAFPFLSSSADNAFTCGFTSPNSPDNPLNVLLRFFTALSRLIEPLAATSIEADIISMISCSVRPALASCAINGSNSSSPYVLILCNSLA